MHELLASQGVERSEQPHADVGCLPGKVFEEPLLVQESYAPPRCGMHLTRPLDNIGLIDDSSEVTTLTSHVLHAVPSPTMLPDNDFTLARTICFAWK